MTAVQLDEVDVTRLAVRPGDVLIATIPAHASQEIAARVMTMIRAVLAETGIEAVAVLVMRDDVALSVCRQPSDDELAALEEAAIK